MDDEVIPRRDAIAGLGLMGTLLVALVGTIGVRIANSSRDQAGPPRPSTATVAATAKAATGDFVIGSIIEAPGATQPAASDEVAEVQQATHEQIAPQPAAPETPAPPAGSAAQLNSEAPRFIAPSLP